MGEQETVRRSGLRRQIANMLEQVELLSLDIRYLAEDVAKLQEELDNPVGQAS